MNISRREFASFLGKVVVLTGIVGSVPVVASKEVTSRRPPGAVAEDVFRLVCVRCGRCAEVCPPHIIRLVNLWENPAAAGTPVLVDNGVCQLDFKCIEVCPSGALQPVPKSRAKMGTSSIIRDKCIGCGICIKVCDQIAEAIDWEDPKKTKAVINPGKCLGCGACVPECPVQAITLSARGAYRPPFSWPKGGSS